MGVSWYPEMDGLFSLFAENSIFFNGHLGVPPMEMETSM